MDESGVRGTGISDPTAKQGARLADPPQRIKTDMLWIEAVNDAWAECHALDDGAERGLAYTLANMFCLAGKVRRREDNAAARRDIAEECGISERALYKRISTIVGIVEYHAARRGLV